MTIAHAWLQKHATPTARGGEFHWHPAENALPALIERLHGATPPCVLWELAPGRVVWAQAFAATAPSDGRRYTGLVATISAGATASLAELVVPPAEPWSGHLASVPDELPRSALGDGVAIAQALLFGGDAELAEPTHRGLPRVIAELEALVPAELAARSRTGTWRAPRNVATLARAAYEPAAELLAAAWRGRDTPWRATPWRATVELARAQRRDVRDVARSITDGAPLERALTIAERAVLGEPLAWPRVVNAWGRGKLAAADVTVRIADALAARVIGELASGRDGRAAITAVRWHALLPAARRSALLATLAERTASLQELIDA